jgi:dTDP-4-amino-4,6-dideoxygalactose transaminase
VTTRYVPFVDLGSSVELAAADLDAGWEAVKRHGRFVNGPEVGVFEAEFARYCGVDHCVGVGNGTDALELVLRALGIGANDEVVVPGNTFIATAEAVTNVGARPVFADVDPGTLLMGADDVRNVITPATAAVIAVHLYGQPCYMLSLAEVAAQAGVALIEDAAQAHGAAYAGSAPAQHSVAATYSFYPGKNLGAFGDAGAVVTNDPRLAESVRQISAHGRSAANRYLHDVVGRNSRLDTLQAAVLSARLVHLDRENAHRALVHRWYREWLPRSVQLVEQAPGRTSSFHLMVAQTDDRDDLRDQLSKVGVETGLHYPVPCHRQLAYREAEAGSCLPVVEAAAGRILSLPCWGHISEPDVAFVCEQIRGLRA